MTRPASAQLPKYLIASRPGQPYPRAFFRWPGKPFMTFARLSPYSFSCTCYCPPSSRRKDGSCKPVADFLAGLRPWVRVRTRVKHDIP